MDAGVLGTVLQNLCLFFSPDSNIFLEEHESCFQANGAAGLTE